MKYLAHKSDDGREQSIIDHLSGTAERCKEFAGAFGLGQFCEEIGKYHDIGKYSKGFQNRIQNDGPKVDHSTAGAKEFVKVKNSVAALCVAGHHSGLLRMGSKASLPWDGTFKGRLKKDLNNIEMDYSSCFSELPAPQIPDNTMFDKFNAGRDAFSLAFLIRMLFSCLVDADFLDTEAFMSDGAVLRGEFDDIEKLFEKFNGYTDRFKDLQGEINKKRSEILKNCLEKAENVPGLYSLTVPTGGGKTIASLGFALKHALKYGKKRIIYIIPFTSIIEQNADVFREIVGAENVVEHHMNVDYGAYEETTSAEAEKRKLAAENWDAPIIVTTNVQFFESLFAKKTSRCRKLHNIANSVVIFDEAQMLPTEFLKPCTKAIGELVAKYNATAVLCTATQPSLESFFAEDGIGCTEITENPKELYDFFKRVHYENIGNVDEKGLAELLGGHEQVLCVVNTTKTAQEIYDLLDEDGRYHLSTRMCPQHRRAKLKEIRERLKAGLPCRVVSTSLVEAGVDLDFPSVYRELAGLDSIIQAGGRCNREGKRDLKASTVNIFTLERTRGKLPFYIKLPSQTTRSVLRHHGEDPSTTEAIKEYFDLLYELKGDNLDAKKIMAMHDSMDFPKIAQEFVLIEDTGRSVLVPFDERSNEICGQLRLGLRSRRLTRRAGQYSVNVYDRQFEKLVGIGAVEVLDENFAILLDKEIYSEDKGLTVNVENGEAVFV